jgi:AraC-like DNA-binding protein
LIKHYAIIGDMLREPYCDKYIPDGLTALVFNFSGQAICTENGQSTILPRSFLIVPHRDFIYIEVFPPLDSIVVYFNTSVFSRLFKMSLEQYRLGSYREIDLFQGFPMWEYLAGIKGNHSRIRAFEKYLNNMFALKSYEDDQIDRIYNLICSSRGQITVEELHLMTGYNARTFRRHFLSRVGISAKSLSRLVRLNYIWEEISNQKAIDFQNMVFEGNYFDQAHLIKDVRKICGEPPSKFFKRDLSRVKLFSGKSF